MNILTISNQKGGVGKTTTASCLAFTFAKYKKRVLLIDLDQQSNASYILRADNNFLNVYDFLMDNKDINKCIQPYYDDEYLHFIASSNNLSLSDLKLTEVKNGEMLLKNNLSKLKYEYDYIIIDTPPNLGMLTINSYIASDYIIIPTRPDILSLQGIGQLYTTFNTIKQKRNPNLSILGILVTHFDARSNISKKMAEILKDTAKTMNTKIMKYVIRESVKIRESQALQLNITKYSNSVGVVEYFLTAKEIMKEINENIKI